ncbi:basement membrane-specific heparan sulfate proteoglycan core protein-like isoform X2 [Ptychodera flava]|uniref:basement membrane-specific heparan sulfate proteoglycan core protein-like isoform X2 n=1 Tax=Ptychodera flava TaxID=63121 RepID=UPI00396A2CA2
MATPRNSSSFTSLLWTSLPIVIVICRFAEAAKLGNTLPESPKSGREGNSDDIVFSDIYNFQTFDDEDYPNDEVISSGDEEGSGGTIPPGSTLYHRSMMRITNIEYTDELANGPGNDLFDSLARKIEGQIDLLFTGVPGNQEARVVEFKPGSVIVVFDVGTTDFYDSDLIENVVSSAITEGGIGEYEVDPEFFTFFVAGLGPTEAPVVPCKDDEFQCNNGDCISEDFKCNGVVDCFDQTDEYNCPIPTPPTAACRNNQFMCKNGQCIPSTQRCDRISHCNDKSDEDGCIVNCSPGEFQCENKLLCIAERQRCDTVNDCADGSDEVDCPVTCRVEEFPCADRRECISLYQQCDGKADCKDGSDEVDCRDVCTSGQFQCANGQCIDERRKCDNNVDCPDGSDEINCPVPAGTPTTKPCKQDEFTCDNLECIKGDYECDGDRDCTDGSDEMACATPPPCEPNEFVCSNNNCIQRIWRCDGDEDCSDGSDEVQCAAKLPGQLCETWEFQCLALDECVPASYQCDDEIDCTDRSDEIGCSAPVVVTPPESFVQVTVGQTVILKCEAEGIPTPIISWRLNWGHVGPAPRVTSTSIAGVGILTITDARPEDSGAYTCEPMNNKGYIFAVPDGIVAVTPPEGVCHDTVFNEDAVILDECVQCFCFGVVQYCISSSYYRYQNTIYFSEEGDAKGVEIAKYRNKQVDVLDSRYLKVQKITGELFVQDFTEELGKGDFYWMLPAEFLGNQLTSYGGKLQYMIQFETTEIPRASDVPDVIIRGNGITLEYKFDEQPTVGVQNNRIVNLREFGWNRVEKVRGDVPARSRASRQDIMMALQNIEHFLIRASYHTTMTYSSLSDISLDVAIPESTGQPRATLVEDCQCPEGYGGLSCEDCASGYHRIRNNQFLGSCIPCDCNGKSEQCDANTGVCMDCRDNTAGDSCESCEDGYYLDRRSGECEQCACPLTTPSNNFSPTCFQDLNDEVECNACPPGYGGRKCEQCKPGYRGDPTIPGSECRPQQGDLKNCNQSGSMNPGISNRCDCKKNVEGESCDQCVSNTFHLSSDNPEGCISCFCMGTTNQCTHTTWKRSQVVSSFNNDGDVQGFSVVDSRGRSTDRELTRVSSRELLVSGFSTLSPSGVYYYLLPPKFRGNKVTSYGGYLRYTVSHRASVGATSLREPDVILQGNGITLYYYADKSISSSGRVSYQVPFFENYWSRSDGGQAMREFLMMALADVEMLMVRASLTTNMFESSIQDVSMDIAEPQETGQDAAYTVEECRCPPGYRGLSCEDCDSGYTRSEGGLYLGTCTQCECNGHARDCDSETGECLGCLHNTEGANCEVCIPGYYGDPSAGTPRDCLPCPCPLTTPPNQFSPTCFMDTDGKPTCDACPRGYTGRNCERCVPPFVGDPSVQGDSCKDPSSPGDLCGCDSRGSLGDDCDGNRQCTCKENVDGRNCDVCKTDFFNLDISNPDGCTPCFCMGVTDMCQSSDFYRNEITVNFDSSNNNKNMALVDFRGTSVVTTGFTINPNANEIRYNNFRQLPQAEYYWALPPKFRGNQITAYGGYLRFTISYTAHETGNYVSDVDVSIEGNEINLHHKFSNELRSDETRRVEIQMTEDNFYRYDGQQTSREHMMMMLANVKYIHIRATYNTEMRDSSLNDISMENAVPQDTGNRQALDVEECSCPEGYMGLSCQSCAPGYMRTGGGLYLGTCMKCECHGHASECDPDTGACVNCEHNTEGDRCDKCAPGYYGDATAGTPDDCRKCACPLDIPSNQFSPTCYLDNDGTETCNACKDGYTGRKCERCDVGYVGNPEIPGGTCTPVGGAEPGENRPPSVIVSPSRISDSVGSTITFDCIVTGSYSTLAWVRSDGKRLSIRAVELPDQRLQIKNIQKDDEGVYMCQAINNFGAGLAEGQLTVLSDGPAIQVIVEEPTTLQVPEGDTAKIVCKAISQVTYTLVWTKVGGSLPVGATDFMGILTIPNVKAEDSGMYTCTGSNQFAVDQGNARLIVGGETMEEPTVRIDPRFVDVEEGDEVRMTCIATGFPPPQLKWTGGQGGILNPKHSFINGVFTIPEVEKSDEAEYFCEASNAAGSVKVRTVIYVSASLSPRVSITPEVLSIQEGEQAVLLCTSSGDPKPSISWTRVDLSMPSTARQQSGYLIIQRITQADAGSYKCTASNGVEMDEGIATISVTGRIREPPSVRVEPSSVSVAVGGTAVVRCIAEGDPLPTVTWSRADGQLAANHLMLDNVLRIVQADIADSGAYICTAQNIGGTVTASTVVDVALGREAPKIEIFPQASVTVSSGEDAEFECRVTGGFPQPLVSWTRAGNAPFTTRTGAYGEILSFIGVSSEEQGTYICTASNNFGSVQAAAVLKVHGLPSVAINPPGVLEVKVGQAISLECMAEGDPMPSLTWERMGEEEMPETMEVIRDNETPGSAVFRIMSAAMDDSGTYVCKASSPAGDVEDRIVLNVIEDIEFGPPVVIITPAKLTVAIGQPAEFRCEAPGSIIDYTIVWRKRNGLLPAQHSVDNGVLVIASVSNEDAGEYICEGTNTFGSKQTTAVLIVQGLPQFRVSPSSVVVTAGQPIRLQVIVEEISGQVDIEWEKVGGQLPQTASDSDGVLLIPSATATDSGTYKVTVTNNVGSKELLISVTVRVPPTIVVSPIQETRAEGRSVEFQCTGSGTPRPTVEWSKEVGRLPSQHTVRNGLLSMGNLRKQDAGRYVCTATNSGGTSTAFVTLSIQALPKVTINIRTQVQTIPVGDSVTFDCQAMGEPKPIVRWSKLDGEIPSTVMIMGGVLTIRQVESKDAGTYQCTATNAAGSVQSQVVLYVQAAPRVTVSPEIRTSAVGATAIFTCIANGSPVPDVYWYRPSGDLPLNHRVENGILTIPQVSRADAGSYICRAANRQGSKEFLATLNVGEMIPYFVQNPVSYISYPALRDAYLQFELEISFKPETTDGLIIYNGQTIGMMVAQSAGDFLSFGMSGGHTEFRFDMGSGAAIIRSAAPLELNQWHTVILRRNRRQGSMIVDGQIPVNGTSLGGFQGLDLTDRLFVGGLPSDAVSSKSSGFNNGFIGCVSRLEIDGVGLDLGSTAKSVVGVQDCPVCQGDPCKNGGTCREASTHYGYRCICPSGFTGRTCEDIGERCYPGVCGDGECVNNVGSSGFRCICPLGKTGQRCETGVTVLEPAFRGNSYLTYSGLHTAVKKLKLMVTFKPKSLTDGLILFNGQALRGKGDFISLAVKDKTIEYRYDSGTGTVTIQSSETVMVDKWYTVIIDRNFQDGSLTVNGGEVIRGRSPGNSRGLNLELDLYIGGHNHFMDVPERVGVQGGFIGCISEIEINDAALDLISSSTSSANIEDCNDKAPCERHPCKNGGTCLHLGDAEYECICLTGKFTGRNCQLPINPCSERDPCKNGGTCQPLGEEYKCNCPLGFTGSDCQFTAVFDYGAAFSSDGFISFPKSIIPRRNGNTEEIVSLTFKTTAANGLMLWQGEKEGNPGRGKDYVSLGVKDSILVFSFELGSGEANIYSNKSITDGQWHSVVLKRTGQVGSMNLDNEGEISGRSAGSLINLNVKGNVYIGGAPDLEILTGKKYKSGIVGCVFNVVIQVGEQAEKRINLLNDAKYGINAMPCENQP